MNNLNIDAQIEQYRSLNQKIKALELEKEAIKKELVTGYFAEHETYVNQDGKLLATYKEQIRVVLNQKLLKETYPDIVEEFSDLQSIRVFLCK